VEDTVLGVVVDETIEGVAAKELSFAAGSCRSGS
jgi:hypothetical protein